MRRSTVCALPAVALAVAHLVAPDVLGVGGAVFNLYNASALVSAVSIGVAVLLRRPRPMAPWLLIAGSIGLWVLGDALYSVLGTSSAASYPDLAYLPAYGGLIAALVLLLRAGRAGSAGDSLIDSAMVLAAGLLVVWELIIEPGLGSSPLTDLSQIVVAIYPVLDVVLLVLLVQLFFLPAHRGRSVQLLAAAVAATLSADVVYAVLEQTGAYGRSPSLAHALNSTWLISYALFAVAAWQAALIGDAAGRAGFRFGAGRLAAAGIALVAVPLSVVLARYAYGDSDVETVLISTATVVPLVMWRIARLNNGTQRTLDTVAGREAYYRGMALNSSDAFVLVDASARVLDVSPAIGSLLGIDPAAAIGTDASAVVFEADRDLAVALLADAQTKPGARLSAEVRARTASGNMIWVELRVTNLLDDPSVGGIVINTHDVTARKTLDAELSHLAFHDALTGLANRSLVRDRITHALVRRGVPGTVVSVAFCDLDGFKSVNDGLGHDAGDEVLRVAAERLQRVVRPEDTVARNGGDEFVVLFEQSTPDEARAMGERLRQVMSDPMLIDGSPLIVTASIGLACAGTGPTTADDLLRDADAAMYRAKSAGRNCVVVYDAAMRLAAAARQDLEGDLVGALDRDEFLAYFQPLVNLEDGGLVGFEALIRWNHPTRGLLLPADFIGLAEQSGAIVPIGEWMLRTACNQAAAWQQLRGTRSSLTMSVNLSAPQLADDDIVNHVTGALRESSLDPNLLVLELTESMLVENPADAAATLHALQALGVRLAIDDFGVGFSSLSYLRQFPFDILKIDRSFIEGIDDPKRLPAIVRGLLELGNTLDLEVIAEGIEDDTQRQSLVSEGCRLGQGFYFARPLTPADASELAASRDLIPRLELV